MSKVDKSAPIVPLFIGPGNAMAATGAPWRWCRDTANALGVRMVHHGRKQLIPAAAFLDALSKDSGSRYDGSGFLPDAAAELRERLGLRPRTKL